MLHRTDTLLWETIRDIFIFRDAPRLLVAEDNDAMRRLLVITLKKDGYELITAEDGYELIEHIKSPPAFHGRAKKFDLIISDLRMPLFSGLDGLRALREKDQTTPMIIITAFGNEETHAEARRLGARVLDKPFDMEALRSAIHELAPPVQN